SERVPALDALAGTITLASAVLTSAGGVAGAVAGVATGLVSAFVFTLVSTDFLTLVGAGGVAGPGSSTEAVAIVAAPGFVAVMGLFGASLPITSMISRSGSRRVKLVTRPTVPTSKTTRTVDASYWPTRICCSNPDLTGHCFPTSIEFKRAGVISMNTRSGPFASP